jgi:hypothetical protein
VKDLRIELAIRRWKLKYSPDQPRVPAGSGRESGRWTEVGGQGPAGTRLAASDMPRPPGPRILRSALQLAKRAIEAYRSENGLWDLFGNRDGTVTVITIDGKDIFGSNSSSPTYRRIDRLEVTRLRDTLMEKYPDVMNIDNVGRKPNDALFHAETTVLVRAARENGGTLSGRTLEVYSDRKMCNTCDVVLPLVGRELGNPTVTFVGPGGVRKTMRDARGSTRSVL